MTAGKPRYGSVDRWRPRLELTALIVIIVTGLLVAAVMLRQVLYPAPVIVRTTAPARPAAGRGVPAPTLPAAPIAIDGARSKGDPRARVVIVEFAEFQCPWCARFCEDTLPALAQKYLETGAARMVFWHVPLEQIHPYALKAAEAAECAGEQGRFWEMHDLLFATSKQLDETSLRQHARTLGLTGSEFDGCLDGTMTDKVRRQAEQARALAVSGTPTFFIGLVQPDGRLLVRDRFAGAQPLARFSAAIDKLLAEVEPATGGV